LEIFPTTVHEIKNMKNRKKPEKLVAHRIMNPIMKAPTAPPMVRLFAL
jgi:hypothetical protein